VNLLPVTTIKQQYYGDITIGTLLYEDDTMKQQRRTALRKNEREYFSPYKESVDDKNNLIPVSE
jgi:hypothetical protein